MTATLFDAVVRDGPVTGHTGEVSAGPAAGDADRPAGDVLAGLAALVGADLQSADRDTIAELVGTSRQVRGWLDAFDVGCARRTTELAAEGRSESSESMLGRSGHASVRDARMARLRAETCDLFALFEHALRGGHITIGHVDALGAAIRDLPEEARAELIDGEEQLVARARRLRPDDFARWIRIHVADVVGRLDHAAALAASLVPAGDSSGDTDGQPGMTSEPSPDDRLSGDPLLAGHERQRAASKIRRWVDTDSGMHMTLIALDPVRDEQFKQAFNTQLNRLRATHATSKQPWQEVQIDALLAMVRTSLAPYSDAKRPGGNGGSSVPEICVVTTLDRLTSDAAAHGLCETSGGEPLAPATLRRLLCDASVYPAVLGGAGEVLDAGRTTRTVTPAQRRALRAMHRTCGEPECRVPFDDCRIHHVRWWVRDHGRTDLESLLPLCERHHHLIHEGGWILTMTPDRVATWIRPDGTHHHTGSTVDRPNTDERGHDDVPPM